MSRFWILFALLVLLGLLSLNSWAAKQQEVPVQSIKEGGVVPVEKIQKSQAEWKKELSKEQYHILREKGTERAFTGKYHDYKGKGMYHCAACGAELFDSDTKFDSKTGWPSYWEPVSNKNVTLKEDNTLFMKRTEVVCTRCGSHLGHVFKDGPNPTGLRYCINSLALNFKEEQ